MRISVVEAYRRWRRDELQFIDARSAKWWDQATDRLPGAVRIRPDAIDPFAVPRGRTIVTYCT